MEFVSHRWFKVRVALAVILALELSAFATVKTVSAQFQIKLGSTEIRENSVPVGSGNVGVGDFEDNQGNLIDYELVDGEGSEGNGFFFIRKKANNSQLQATPRQGFDRETQAAYSIRVRASLNNVFLDERTFTIDVLNVEEPPTKINITNSTVAQGSEEGTDVGTLSVTGGAPITIEYSLVGVDEDLFELEGNILEVGDDFEELDAGEYAVTIRAAGDGFLDSTFTVSVIGNQTNEAPVAEATATPTSGTVPLTVSFDGSGSTDDGTIVSYAWDFGDGNSSTAESPSHTYTAEGEYTATLTVTDDLGVTSTNDSEVTIIVNDAPTPELTLSTTSISVDEDFSEPQEVTATLLNAPQNVSFSIDPPSLDFATLTASVSGNIYAIELNSNPHLNGNADVIVRATDNDTEQTYDQQLSIEVTAVNDPPSFTIADEELTVAANSEAQTITNFATNITPGPNEVAQTVEFDVQADDPDLFSEQPSISPDGTLRYEVAEDKAGESVVSVVLEDSGDGANTSEIQNFTLAVEAPQASNLELDGNTVDENQPEGTFVGTLSADAITTVRYELPAGEQDNDAFRIEGDRLLTNQEFDFEAKNEYTIFVRACNRIVFVINDCTDGTFTININDIEEPPTSIELDKQTVVENQPVGTVVGLLSASGGAVPSDEITFSLVAGGDNFSIVGNELRTTKVFDFETAPNTFQVSVVAQGNGDSDPQAFTITIEDEDESVAPTEVSLSNTTIAEGAAGIIVGTLSSNGTEPLTFRLVAGDGDTDNSKFEIVGTTLRTTTAIDFEEPTTADGLAVRIQASNSQGSFSDNFAISVDNVEEPPTDITLSNATVQENQANAVVGTLEASGGVGPYTFSLVGTANDNDLFEIEGTQLKTRDGLNFEASETRTVTIRASNDGSFQETFTITVTNVLEPPTDITLSNSTIQENQADAVVGTFSAEGGAEPFTFSLSGSGNNKDLFTIEGNQLKTVSGLDFESQPSINLEVTVNSADGDFTKVFTITVVNTNEPPTSLSLSSTSVNENEPSNTLVGTFSATGGSVANPTFQFIGNNNDNDLFKINGNQLRTNIVFDREKQAAYNIRVRAVGEGNFARNFTINIDNVNDAPQISVTEDRIVFAEGGEPVKVLEDITVNDVDNTEISSATLSFANNYVPGEDELLTDADHQWNNQNGRLIINGPLSLADMQRVLRDITYINKKDINPTSSARQIRVVVNDGALDSNVEQVFVLVDNPNEPPVITDFTVEVAEDDSRAFAASDFEDNYSDSDDAFPDQIYLEAGTSEGSLTVDGVIITSELILASGSRGFLVDFAVVESMVYTPTEDFNGEDQFRWNVYDDDNGGSPAIAKINVLPVNDAPEIIAPSELVVEENSSITLSDIEFLDIDDDNLTLVLSVTNGSLVPNASVSDDVSVVEEDKRIQISGTAQNLASILSEIAYIPAPEISTQDVLALILTDNPADAATSLTAEASVNISVGVNEPPQVSDIALEINSGEVYTFDESIFVNAYTDPDNFPTDAGFPAIRISTLPANGQLVFNEQLLSTEELGETGFLIARDDISQLRYQAASTEVTTDQFGWNATDGSKFAEEDATVAITIKLLSITLSADTEEVCLGESVTLTAAVEGGTAPLSYQWTCGQDNCNINSTTEVATVDPTVSASYQLIVTDANGVQASASVAVNVVDCSLVIPTGFTPNGDNINDTWELQNINTFEQKLVEVYDRHGHRVFFSDNYDRAWDGSYNGTVLPTGTYYYRIELDAGSQSFRGKVTILQ